MEQDDFATTLVHELDSLPELKTVPMRKLRKKYSKRLRAEDSLYVLEAARTILDSGKHRWIAYELIYDHPDAFHSLDRNSLEALGHGINSW